MVPGAVNCNLWAGARPQTMVYQSSTTYLQKWRGTLEKPLQHLGRVTVSTEFKNKNCGLVFFCMSLVNFPIFSVFVFFKKRSMTDWKLEEQNWYYITNREALF